MEIGIELNAESTTLPEPGMVGTTNPKAISVPTGLAVLRGWLLLKGPAAHRLARADLNH